MCSVTIVPVHWGGLFMTLKYYQIKILLPIKVVWIICLTCWLLYNVFHLTDRVWVYFFGMLPHCEILAIIFVSIVFL